MSKGQLGTARTIGFNGDGLCGIKWKIGGSFQHSAAHIAVVEQRERERERERKTGNDREMVADACILLGTP